MLTRLGKVNHKSLIVTSRHKSTQMCSHVSSLLYRSLGGEVSHDGDFMIFEGNRYSRKGFLFKSFAMSAVVSTYTLVFKMHLAVYY